MVGNQVLDPHIEVISADKGGNVGQPKYVWNAPPRIADGGKRFYGELKVDDGVYTRGEVELKYWPNAETMPSFVLPKAADQRVLTAQD